MKDNSGVSSLIALLRIDGAAAPATTIRTVGLTEALKRTDRFVKSKANKTDRQRLADMRNGIVHAAEDVEVEERILAAFAQHADALLADLDRSRDDFWRGQLTVVDALLKDASDKLAHRVEVRLAAATAWFEHRHATEGEAVISVLRAVSKSAVLTAAQRFQVCPVCDSFGIATGEHIGVDREVWFAAQTFRCRVCGLRLDSEAEIDAGGFDPVWEIEDADWRDYEAEDDGDTAYERWREEMQER